MCLPEGNLNKKQGFRIFNKMLLNGRSIPFPAALILLLTQDPNLNGMDYYSILLTPADFLT